MAAAAHREGEYDEAEGGDDHGADDEGDAEEQPQRDRPADDLGEVGHDDDDLRLRPQQHPTDPR